MVMYSFYTFDGPILQYVKGQYEANLGEIVDAMYHGNIGKITVSPSEYGEEFDINNTLVGILRGLNINPYYERDVAYLDIYIDLPIPNRVDAMTIDITGYFSDIVSLLRKFKYEVHKFNTNKQEDGSLNDLIDRLNAKLLDSRKKPGIFDYFHSFVRARRNPDEKRATVYMDGSEKQLIIALKSFLYKALMLPMDRISVTWNDDAKVDAKVDIIMYSEKTEQADIDALYKQIRELVTEFIVTYVARKETYEESKAKYDDYYNIQISNLKTHFRNKVHLESKKLANEEEKAKARLDRPSGAEAGPSGRDRDESSTLRAGFRTHLQGLMTVDVKNTSVSEIGSAINEKIYTQLNAKFDHGGRIRTRVTMMDDKRARIDIEWSLRKNGEKTSMSELFNKGELIVVAAIFLRYKHFKIRTPENVFIECFLGEFVEVTNDNDKEENLSEFHVDYTAPGSFSGTEIEDLEYIAFFNITLKNRVSFNTEKYKDLIEYYLETRK